ncbi:hypothetical protein WA158_003746 [Blastocystis sp. Blastoise]
MMPASVPITEISCKKDTNNNDGLTNYIPKTEWNIGDFDLVKRLGKGRFGHIYLAKECHTDFIVALKVMRKSDITKHKIERQLRREIEIQSHLHHKNILQMYGFFHDEKLIYMILEYCPRGSLFNELEKKQVLTEERVASLMKSICDAIYYCHQKHIFHRDLKPENILLGYYGEPKIADFGWSIHSYKQNRMTFCGTPDYISPEMILHKPYDHTTDIWCLGILAYELLVGHPPFQGESQDILWKHIIEGKIKFPSFVSFFARDFISKFLVVDPTKRIDLATVPFHPWITKYCKNNEN